MPTITYIAQDGTVTQVVAANGTSVMQAALIQGLRGIDADCGGACQCATCHVYVDEAWAAKLPPVDDEEDAMLDSAADQRKANSRLSCCITMSDAIDGIVVRLPARQ